MFNEFFYQIEIIQYYVNIRSIFTDFYWSFCKSIMASHIQEKKICSTQLTFLCEQQNLRFFSFVRKKSSFAAKTAARGFQTNLVFFRQFLRFIGLSRNHSARRWYFIIIDSVRQKSRFYRFKQTRISNKIKYIRQCPNDHTSCYKKNNTNVCNQTTSDTSVCLQGGVVLIKILCSCIRS